MARIIEDQEGISALVKSLKRVAVLGIKTEAQAGQPSFDVPAYLQRAGIDVVPVPVYYPDVNIILGQKVYRRVADVPGPIDCVDVFRRSQDLKPHLDDLLAAKPRSVWFQLGISDDEVAAKLVEAGIDVVQDRCLLVEHRIANR